MFLVDDHSCYSKWCVADGFDNYGERARRDIGYGEIPEVIGSSSIGRLILTVF